MNTKSRRMTCRTSVRVDVMCCMSLRKINAMILSIYLVLTVDIGCVLMNRVESFRRRGDSLYWLWYRVGLHQVLLLLARRRPRATPWTPPRPADAKTVGRAGAVRRLHDVGVHRDRATDSRPTNKRRTPTNTAVSARSARQAPMIRAAPSTRVLLDRYFWAWVLLEN